MPAIIITGIPCSGKSRRTSELQNFFMEKQIKVEIVSEIDVLTKAGYNRNTFFADSKKEKAIRSDIRSNLQHLLNPKDILIIDASNYIKGYRYELYCLSKSFKTPQCTVHCDVPVEHAWLLNDRRPEEDKYSRETFDALVMRYEAPDSKNRWDSPLFAVTPDDMLPLNEIYRCLFDVKAPKPNMSTQSPPVLSTNYLYELDRITQNLVNEIIAAGKLGITNDIKLSGSDLSLERGGTASQLTRLRRQFLTYSKMQQLDVNKIATLFIQYLNKSL